MDRDALPGACRSRVQTILVLNKAGQIQWAKDGSLTPEEVDHVIALAQKLINE
ncbi:transcriptional regulator [Escherichia coli]|uniref:Transcriptional regulator n=1 Tax=Escherichia coli TaxID=562 RepID=A0A376KNL2_ECOLX|nr:transcriptional regulator [Escherichia coli]